MNAANSGCARVGRERRPPARRQGHRLTPERLAEVQALLDQGQSVPEINRQTGILASTLHKAIDQGRLKQIKKKIGLLAVPS